MRKLFNLIAMTAIVTFFGQTICHSNDYKSFNAEGILEASKMKQTLDIYLSNLQNTNPEKFTGLGLSGVEHQLTPRTDINIAEQLNLAENTLSSLEQINVDVLNTNDYYNYLMFSGCMKKEIHMLTHFSPLNNPLYYIEPLEGIYDLIHRSKGLIHKRLENALIRLEQLPQILQSTQNYLKNPPKIWVEAAIAQSKDAKNTLNELAPYFNELLSMDLTSKETIEQIIAESKTALEQFGEFLRNKILPRSKGSVITGKKSYEYYIENWHLLDDSPKKIAKTAKKTFYLTKKDFLTELAQFLKKDEKTITPSQYGNALSDFGKKHPNEGGLLAAFADEIQAAYNHFAQVLEVAVPEQTIKVLQTPGYKKSFSDSARYFAPYALDRAKSAEIYINAPEKTLDTTVKEMLLRNNFSYPYIKLSVVHLVAPGKFFYDTKSGNKSKFESICDYPVIVNGWANYSFKLARESGYIQNSEETLAALYWQLIKYARAYIDAALHTGEISYNEAYNFLIEEAGLSPVYAKGELLKISLNPTNAVTYFMGEREILKLRKNFADKYVKLADFHNAFLNLGKIPVKYFKEEFKKLTK